MALHRAILISNMKYHNAQVKIYDDDEDKKEVLSFNETTRYSRALPIGSQRTGWHRKKNGSAREIPQIGFPVLCQLGFAESGCAHTASLGLRSLNSTGGNLVQ